MMNSPSMSAKSDAVFATMLDCVRPTDETIAML